MLPWINGFCMKIVKTLAINLIGMIWCFLHCVSDAGIEVESVLVCECCVKCKRLFHQHHNTHPCWLNWTYEHRAHIILQWHHLEWHRSKCWYMYRLQWWSWNLYSLLSLMEEQQIFQSKILHFRQEVIGDMDVQYGSKIKKHRIGSLSYLHTYSSPQPRVVAYLDLQWW